jgi:hypothetical protein
VKLNPEDVIVTLVLGKLLGVETAVIVIFPLSTTVTDTVVVCPPISLAELKLRLGVAGGLWLVLVPLTAGGKVEPDTAVPLPVEGTIEPDGTWVGRVNVGLGGEIVIVVPGIVVPGYVVPGNPLPDIVVPGMVVTTGAPAVPLLNVPLPAVTEGVPENSVVCVAAVVKLFPALAIIETEAVVGTVAGIDTLVDDSGSPPFRLPD